MGRRYWVVGNSGSGKTHLARRLAARLDLPHLELDSLNHRAGWTEAPAEEFRGAVERTLHGFRAVAGGWVVDGNYRSRLAGVVDADTYVWLDYPRSVVMPRVVRRSLARVLTRRELWNGNRERWSSLVSRDPRRNIIVWAWVQHGTYRRAYGEARRRESEAAWVRLSCPRAAERWLTQVGRDDV